MEWKRKPPDDEGWGGEILARYKRGVMLLLFILAVTFVALIIWLRLISSAYKCRHINKGRRPKPNAPAHKCHNCCGLAFSASRSLSISSMMSLSSPG